MPKEFEQRSIASKAMSARMKTIERWRTRLAECQQRVVGCPAHRRWVHEIYVRVFRFLISCYDADDADAAGAVSVADEEPTRMKLVDNREDEQGTPPKSAERIRATLDAVRGASEHPASPGPSSGGLEFNDWIAAASQTSLVSPGRFVRLLRQNDIEARRVRRGDDIIVEVFAGRRAEAMELLERHRSCLRIPPRHIRQANAIDAIDHVVGNACLGGFVGAMIGVIPMLLLTGILDAVYSPRSSSTGGTIVSVVLSIGWGAFFVVGAIVAVWRYYKRSH